MERLERLVEGLTKRMPEKIGVPWLRPALVQRIPQKLDEYDAAQELLQHLVEHEPYYSYEIVEAIRQLLEMAEATWRRSEVSKLARESLVALPRVLGGLRLVLLSNLIGVATRIGDNELEERLLHSLHETLGQRKLSSNLPELLAAFTVLLEKRSPPDTSVLDRVDYALDEFDTWRHVDQQRVREILNDPRTEFIDPSTTVG